jgi:uncharacterized membrane protein YbhN (UPF0104 family)
MRAWIRKWWPVLKALLAVAIVAAVGRQFARDLQSPELWQRSIRLEWLVVSGALYLLGLGCSALFWYRLLRSLGQQPFAPAAVRAYYLGHLGKYLPGKAWALLMRATLVQGHGVRLGVAAMTSLYEVLTTMSAGVLLAALILPFQLPDTPPGTSLPVLRRLLTLEVPDTSAVDRRGILLLIGVLLCAVGIPILPGVFNRIVKRLTQRFRQADAAPLPHVGTAVLAEGLFLTGIGWLFLGGSLWAACQAVLDQPQSWSWDSWARYTAFLALAYVAGFVILIVPSGLGVREFFLTLFLVPEIRPFLASGDREATATVVLIVLLLRLAWTAAEVVMASVVYWLPGEAKRQPLRP